MIPIRADAIAVYVYRQPVASELEFLQIRRSELTGEYHHSWQIVYGGIEGDETPIAAALRELKEEISLLPQNIIRMLQVEYIETFYFQPKNYITMMPVFSVEIGMNTPLTLNHEHDGIRWVKQADISTFFMWRSQREALAAIVDEILHPSLAHDFLKIDIGSQKK